jgi:hypothetical protein
MVSIRMVAAPIQTLNASSISSTYMGIGPRFDHSARVVRVANYTDGLLMFSWNGIDDHFPLLVYTSIVITICNNDQDNSDYFALPALNRLYVREVKPATVGYVCVTEFRGINDA